MFRLLIFSIFDEDILINKNHSLQKDMSKNNEANRKKNKNKIDQKKRKIQTAEAERKARLKQIREDFKAKEANDS
ncbi:MAG: uncharacterized protein K0R77_3022 [Chryseobacterium sp.]|uniref:hypothetical protein n=1 Tax=Chryseobacterium sp. TaxID=1871047 RepID=UPI002601925C|nr:hypothetical protein [Chryseobacterium sp.]MDF2553747.1 uncharacterized protein [Chryseobacterium sp.]